MGIKLLWQTFSTTNTLATYIHIVSHSGSFFCSNKIIANHINRKLKMSFCTKYAEKSSFPLHLCIFALSHVHMTTKITIYQNVKHTSTIHIRIYYENAEDIYNIFCSNRLVVSFSAPMLFIAAPTNIYGKIWIIIGTEDMRSLSILNAHGKMHTQKWLISIIIIFFLSSSEGRKNIWWTSKETWQRHDREICAGHKVIHNEPNILIIPY